MDSSIDLTLQGIHGVVWRPCRVSDGNDSVPLSAIKAFVSFSGSVPNMKVSSCAMCPEKGSLVVESETNEIVEISERDTEIDPQKPQLLNTTFTDPFEEKRVRRQLSSYDSSSSHTSGSSCRPHLQFDLRRENGNGDEVRNENPHTTTNTSDVKPNAGHQNGSRIQLDIAFRSVDGDSTDICTKGVAHLKLPWDKFETLPLVLDLPITPSQCSDTSNTDSEDGADHSQIIFESSAFIRVRLDNASKRQQDLSPHRTPSQEYLLSDHVDEIQLVGMVKKIHEYEEMRNIRDNASRPQLFGGGPRRRFLGFGCGGTSDLKQSIQAFFDGMRGMNTKCVDPDQELVTSATMTSTIVTRESLEI
mmetsp:Transcript_11933/g.34217  ORF Transcript_11933/g.34217 Transcript_11933/m.34217 type:complete len:360 (-) Transcript_11933:230-1309(-)